MSLLLTSMWPKGEETFGTTPVFGPYFLTAAAISLVVFITLIVVIRMVRKQKK